MDTPTPRLFADDAAVVRIGEGLLAATLPRAEWTHEAHLAACLYLLRERPDVDVDARIGAIIARYNESVGGVNDDHHGYHDTITRSFLAGVRAFLRGAPADAGLAALVNALLVAPAGGRDWPLRFYTRERLFSIAARRGFVPPDRQALPG
jgi:hypothetical protein